MQVIYEGREERWEIGFTHGSLVIQYIRHHGIIVLLPPSWVIAFVQSLVVSFLQSALFFKAYIDEVRSGVKMTYGELCYQQLLFMVWQRGHVLQCPLITSHTLQSWAGGWYGSMASGCYGSMALWLLYETLLWLYDSMPQLGRIQVMHYRKALDNKTIHDVEDMDTPLCPIKLAKCCLVYTSPSPRDLSTSRMPSSA